MATGTISGQASHRACTQLRLSITHGGLERPWMRKVPSVKRRQARSTEPCSGAESHHQAKLILNQLQRLTADIDAPVYDKAVKDLKEIVLKHFADEEKSLFPAIDKCSEKADELNQKLKAFKADRSLSPSVESLLSK